MRGASIFFIQPKSPLKLFETTQKYQRKFIIHKSPMHELFSFLNPIKTSRKGQPLEEFKGSPKRQNKKVLRKPPAQLLSFTSFIRFPFSCRLHNESITRHERPSHKMYSSCPCGKPPEHLKNSSLQSEGEVKQTFHISIIYL